MPRCGTSPCNMEQGETATNTVFMPVSSLSVWRGDRGHFVPLCAGPHLTFIQLQLVPTGQPGPGPAAPRAGSSSPHRQGHRFRYSVLLLRYCPCGCILAACPSCVPTPPPQPISISTSSRRSSSILAATGELIKNRNSWMNRIHETNKIRKDGHILDDGLVIFF